MFKINNVTQFFIDIYAELRTGLKYNNYNKTKDSIINEARESCNFFKKWRRNNALAYRKCPICNSNHLEHYLNVRGFSLRYDECKTCGFIFTNPVPNEKEFYKIYDKPNVGKKTLTVPNKSQPLSIAQKLKRVLLGSNNLGNHEYNLNQITKFKQSGKFLDYGCGGSLSLKIASQTFDAYGIDIDQKNLDAQYDRGISKERLFNIQNLDSNHFHNFFDVIYTNNNIEHLYDPLKDLELFYKWLKPGGIIYIAAPGADSFTAHYLKNKDKIYNLHHISMFNEKSISYALTKIGYIIIKYNSINSSQSTNTIDLLRVVFIKKFLVNCNFVKSKSLFILLFLLIMICKPFVRLLTYFRIIKSRYFYVVARKPAEEDDK